ncbi:MAG: heme A synthase [Acidimicrobiia bacterium]|nr:heme A synthase [Acidimicrobiia bacterium]
MLLRTPTLSPRSYQRITLIATFLLAIIIVTGGAVRLSGSGLGCPDWPTCSTLKEHGAYNGHAVIEFVNRLFTGLVSLAVIVCVLGSLRREPKRRDLTRLSLGLVAGVFGQALLGGLVVIFELQPPLVMAHFLLSLALLTNAIVLHRRAAQPEGPAHLVVESQVRSAGRVLLAAAAGVVVAGTVVTATGPHGGDEEAKRFTFDLPEVARLHGAFVIALIFVTLLTFVLLRRTQAPVGVQQRLGVLFGVILVQGAIGYIQYFNDIPAVLVGFHIAGATAMWSAAIWYYLGLSTREQPTVPSSDGPREPALAGR